MKNPKKTQLSCATWSSGYMVNKVLFIKDYNDGYFLTDPVLFGKNHYPIQKKWFLNDALAQSEFVVSPLVYGETFEYKIIPVSPKKLNVETVTDTNVDFSFKTVEQISNDNIKLIQYSGSKEKSFKIYDLGTENGLTSFKCKFKHSGSYDVHLKIHEDVVASYTIRVTKTQI